MHNTPQRPSYSDKLKDWRWQRKSAEIKAAAGWRCEDRGQHPDREMLDVHHCAYIPGREPWDYPNDLLMCLCHPCHEWRQGREDGFRVALGSLFRHLEPNRLEEEFWRIEQELRLRQTERYAEAFS